MDAPLITLDDAANTTDVYAFVSQRYGRKYLTTALAVYPHEEPGIGPNKYNFDDDVLYEIRVATGDDVAKGRTTYAYQFRFDTTFRNRNTILQSYLGVIGSVGDASQNLIQRYTVDKVDWRTGCHHAARTRHRPAQQPGERHAEVQPQRRRRAARQGRRGRRGRPRRLHGAVDRRARGRLPAPSPASGTTGSMPTCRRSSIC